MERGRRKKRRGGGGRGVERGRGRGREGGYRLVYAGFPRFTRSRKFTLLFRGRH